MLLQFPDTATALDCFEFREFSFFFASSIFFNFFAFFLRRHCLPFLPLAHPPTFFFFLSCFFLLFLHSLSFFWHFFLFLSLQSLPPSLQFAFFNFVFLVPFFLFDGTVDGSVSLFFFFGFFFLVPFFFSFGSAALTFLKCVATSALAATDLSSAASIAFSSESPSKQSQIW